MHIVERVPHGGHDLRHLTKAGARVLTFDCRLSVAEEQRVRRHRPDTIHTYTHTGHSTLVIVMLISLQTDYFYLPNALAALDRL